MNAPGSGSGALWLLAVVALFATSAESHDNWMGRGTRPGREGDGEELEIGAQCLVYREANLKSAPTMRFFSGQQHSADSMACNGETASFTLDAKSHQGHEHRLESIKHKLIRSGAYDPRLVTHVIIHGFDSSWTAHPWVCRTKDGILDRSNANVFVLDWEGGARPHLPLDFGEGIANARQVAELTAGFLRDLLELTGGSPSQLHLTGASLGAHLCGFLAHELGEGSVGRITALDPAGPCFGSDDPNRSRGRLSAASAKHVSAFHTNVHFLGLNKNVAQYDVYVNGGDNQPGCLAPIPGTLLSQTFNPQVDKSLGCHHEFAINMIDSYAGPHLEPAPSDNQCAPMGYACDSWDAFQRGACGFCRDNDDRCTFVGVYLGAASGQKKQSAPNVTSTARHYISTGAKTPYCRYHYQVIVATKRGSQTGPFNRRFDLQIEWAGLARTVIVDNKLAAGSSLGAEFLAAMRQQQNSSRTYSETRANQLDTEPDISTALMTFESQLAGASCSESYNSLCYPLGALEGARLLGWSAEELESVQWVALNFMSGISQAERLGQSQLFVVERDADGSVARNAKKLPPGSTDWIMRYYAELRPIKG